MVYPLSQYFKNQYVLIQLFFNKKKKSTDVTNIFYKIDHL